MMNNSTMKPAWPTLVAVALACALSVSACGGGGGGDDSFNPGPGGSNGGVIFYTIRPSVSGSGGTINPAQSVSVQSGTTTSFTLTSDSNYTISSVNGTCGGTLNGNTYTTNAINANCTVVATFAAAGSGGQDFADTATQPSPPANTSPMAFTRDASVEPSLADGVYTFAQVHVITLGTVNECSTSACPSFSRLTLNNQGKWIADAWAYMPIAKQWIQLSTIADAAVSLNLGFSDAYSAGNSWINGWPDFSKSFGKQQNGQWEWTFDGNAVYKLSASSTPLSGSSINPSGTVLGTYTETAKAIDLYFVQESGQLFLRGKRSSNQLPTNDSATYANLASFRQSHINKPYCLYNSIGSGYNVSFNPSSGANFTNNSGNCDTFGTITAIGSSEEGVTTVAGKKLILLAPVTAMLSGNNSSVNQFLIGISLDDSGVAAEGKVFQPGYVYAKKNMLNKEALIQVMTAVQPGDSEALNIPMP